MNVMETFNDTFDHYTSKLPPWASGIISVWFLFAGLLYFKLISLPGVSEWLLMLIMLPMAILLLALILHIFVMVIQWLLAPVKWFLKKLRAAK